MEYSTFWCKEKEAIEIIEGNQVNFEQKAYMINTTEDKK
jgi:hypothetical protein